MTYLPLRARALTNGQILHVNDDGQFFASSGLAERQLTDALSAEDQAFLRARNHLVDDEDAFGLASWQFRSAQRLTRAGSLDYLILVPTLRCNLSCSYCQVSRAPLEGRGFDWSGETLA